MERNIYDINREPYAFDPSERGAAFEDLIEPFGWREIRAAGFFGD